MKRRPKSLAAVAGLTAVGLVALALTGLMEWISAVLFLVMELLVESLKSLRARRRPRRHAARVRVAPAGHPPAHHAPVHRVSSRRRVRLRRPKPRAGPGRAAPLS